MQNESTCKCCGAEVAPIWTVTDKFIYNDFDATGQEVDPIWCGEEYDIVGFPEFCEGCEDYISVINDDDNGDDLPF